MKLLDEKEIEESAHKYSPKNGRVQMAYFIGAKYAEQQLLPIMVEFVDSLREYERESHNMIGFDERETSDFLEEFIRNRTMKQIEKLLEFKSEEELNEFIKSENEN